MRADNEPSRDLYSRLLEEAKRHLAEREAELMPFGEEVYQEVAEGTTPEDAAWERQQRIAEARAPTRWKDD